MKKILEVSIGFIAMTAFFVACGQGGKKSHPMRTSSGKKVLRFKDEKGNVRVAEEGSPDVKNEDFRTERKSAESNKSLQSTPVKIEAATQEILANPEAGKPLVTATGGKITIDNSRFKLNLSVNLLCDDKNTNCQETSDLQKLIQSKIQAAKTTWAGTTKTGAYSFNAIQSVNGLLPDLLKDVIATLDTDDGKTVHAMKPHLVLTRAALGMGDKHAEISCQVFDDATSDEDIASTDQYLIMDDDEKKSNHYVDLQNDVILAVSKVDHFTVRLHSTTLICKSDEMKNSESYEALVRNIFSVTFGESKIDGIFNSNLDNPSASATRRGPQSVEDGVLQGTFGKKTWEFKSARVHKKMSGDKGSLKFELFELDIAASEICKAKPENTRIINVDVPLETRVTNEHTEIVPIRDDAQISTSVRTISSQQYYYVDVNQEKLNSPSYNNIDGSLRMDDGQGVEVSGRFIAVICND